MWDMRGEGIWGGGRSVRERGHRLAWGEGRVCGEWERGRSTGRRGDMKEKRDMEEWRGGHGDMLGRGRERVGAATSGRTQLG